MPAEKNGKQSQSDARENDKRNESNRHRRRARIVAMIAIVFFVILFLVGLVPRLMLKPALSAQSKDQTGAPLVNVALVTAPPKFDDLELPGNIQATQQTGVVARASGYVKQWLVDIGDHVRAGQTLATIDSPDLDQEVLQARDQLESSRASFAQAQANTSNQQANLAQAVANLSRAEASYEQARTQLAQSRAALSQAEEQAADQQAQVKQAQANLHLAKITVTRYQNLLADGAIDRQTTDQTVAAYETNLANVQALQAAERASESNVAAFRAAVQSSAANVQAFADGVTSSRAAVTAAAANVQSAAANADAAEGNVLSSQANVRRYIVLQDYETVTAPFAGVITARNVENGTLISSAGVPTSSPSDSTSVGSGVAGVNGSGSPASGSAEASGSSPAASPTSSGPASSLFSIAQLGEMRVYFSIPQFYLESIRVGQTADISVREIPTQTFHGVVVRTAGALDAASRTLVAEIQLANPRHLLRPGMFAEVHLSVPHPGGNVLIPDPAFVSNANGSQVVVIGANNTLHFQRVTVGRDFGETIEVTTGLRVGQQVVLSPSDTLVEGERVDVESAPTNSGDAGGTNAPSGGT